VGSESPDGTSAVPKIGRHQRTFETPTSLVEFMQEDESASAQRQRQSILRSELISLVGC
jgi:hypothetical protein